MTGDFIGMHTFSASASLEDVRWRFGFTPDRVVGAAPAELHCRP